MQQTTSGVDQKATGPLANAGPYTYDLPLRHDPGPPTHLPRPVQKSYKWSWKSSGLIILLNFAAQALHDGSRLTAFESYVAVYGVFTIFGYWVGERPKQSFLSWTLKVIGIWLNCYVGLVTVPASLHGILSEPLAYGLPAFLVALAFYWVPPLKATHANRAPEFWHWLLGAAAAAVFWGWVGATLVR